MSAWPRLGGTEIDTGRSLTFRFDGTPLAGHPGDTVASALLGTGVRIIGRSFKYHRPRGVWGIGVEEPNAIVDIAQGKRRMPNCLATTTRLVEGMEIESVQGTQSARRNRWSLLDRVARFIPAAFYYKTFMWPDWHFYEPRIRALAGLGRMDAEAGREPLAAHRSAQSEVLIIGAGPAGLSAAVTAAERGEAVWLVDYRDRPGGSLVDSGQAVLGQPGTVWADEMLRRYLAAGGRYLSCATALGIADHRLVWISAEEAGGPETLWKLRAGRIVLAPGAFERPLTFADNDRPGIMSAHAALGYLTRFGVRVGKHVALLSGHPSAERTAAALVQAGADVTRLEPYEEPVEAVSWSGGLNGLRTARRKIDCDAILVAGGWTPSVHLHRQAGGKIDWSEDAQAFLPRTGLERVRSAGAASGLQDLNAAIRSGQAAGEDRDEPAPASYQTALWPDPRRKGRQWVDLQNDVTVSDIALAVRENFSSVEHLKRYTTLGMASDQGKTSNMAGLACLAQITGQTIPETGTTTFRPPCRPVSFTTIAGPRLGPLFSAPKRLELEARHLDADAELRGYGGWLRPAFYRTEPAEEEAAAVHREARTARETVALYDGSPLGKIEVLGPDAEAFVEFVYYNTMRTLAPGRVRYGFMLTEGGAVFDDGVLLRMAPDRFVVSCSSSHVEAVARHLDIWRQDRFDPDRVHVQDTTDGWATLTLTGPRARQALLRLDLGIDLGDQQVPHMSHTVLPGGALRLARVSFTGDRSYELTVPSPDAPLFWDRLSEAVAAEGGAPMGLEALMILRAEKGLILVGKDTDGATMPHDLGFGGPRDRKTGEYVGKRSLFTEEANRRDRHALVGLSVEGAPLAPGAHIVEQAGSTRSSIGFVTSSYRSPWLDRPIALALIRQGRERSGSNVELVHLGQARQATVVSPCAFDPDWSRLNA